MTAPSTRGYFVMPDATFFLQVAMGGVPLICYQPVTHPAIAEQKHLNPAATHLEFFRVSGLYASVHPSAHGVGLYVYTRTVCQVGAPIDNQWVEVPMEGR